MLGPVANPPAVSATPATVAIGAAGAAAITLPMIEPGFWGFVGAFVFGAFELSGALWGAGEAAATHNVKALAISRFVIGCVFGAAVGQEFSPAVQGLLRSHGVGMELGAVGLVLGLVGLSAYDPAKKGVAWLTARVFGGAKT